jgi:predicted HicB family RNase H-like nuclease
MPKNSQAETKPTTLQRGIKTIYMRDPELWETAIAYAESRGISLSALIEASLNAHLGGANHAQTKLNEIRRIINSK